MRSGRRKCVPINNEAASWEAASPARAFGEPRNLGKLSAEPSAAAAALPWWRSVPADAARFAGRRSAVEGREPRSGSAGEDLLAQDVGVAAVLRQFAQQVQVDPAQRERAAAVTYANRMYQGALPEDRA